MIVLSKKKKILTLLIIATLMITLFFFNGSPVAAHEANICPQPSKSTVSSSDGPTPIIFVHGIRMDSTKLSSEAPSVHAFLKELEQTGNYHVVGLSDSNESYFAYHDENEKYSDVSLGGNSLPHISTNAEELHKEIKKCYDQYGKKVVLFGYSMGASIIRGELARYGKEDAKYIKFVTFLHGVQQGSWLAPIGGGIGTGAKAFGQSFEMTFEKQYGKVGGKVAEFAVKSIADHSPIDLNAPAIRDLAPKSEWFQTTNKTNPPESIPYYNFYGDIHLQYPINVLPGGLWNISDGADVPIGDGVIFPGTDTPTDTGDLGGTKFKFKKGNEWANHEDLRFNVSLATFLLSISNKSKEFVSNISDSGYHHTAILASDWGKIDTISVGDETNTRGNLYETMMNVFKTEAENETPTAAETRNIIQNLKNGIVQTYQDHVKKHEWENVQNMSNFSMIRPQLLNYATQNFTDSELEKISSNYFKGGGDYAYFPIDDFDVRFTIHERTPSKIVASSIEFKNEIMATMDTVYYTAVRKNGKWVLDTWKFVDYKNEPLNLTWSEIKTYAKKHGHDAKLVKETSYKGKKVYIVDNYVDFDHVMIYAESSDYAPVPPEIEPSAASNSQSQPTNSPTEYAVNYQITTNGKGTASTPNGGTLTLKVGDTIKVTRTDQLDRNEYFERTLFGGDVMELVQPGEDVFIIKATKSGPSYISILPLDEWDLEYKINIMVQ
ncbi:esterase/lipase family protein [Neobacillus rhizophilus]|uniref:Uncharacterized protein n=1 Tax=Neobacillus rhizophilus TaxID=2833579 RepID=A0A942U4W5_9BACI|nr:hypothetical protein [Neobacillus rhizophilus]MBS4212783.1 hypothetical protein [Neobacillus rhizophilus]